MPQSSVPSLSCLYQKIAKSANSARFRDRMVLLGRNPVSIINLMITLAFRDFILDQHHDVGYEQTSEDWNL